VHQGQLEEVRTAEPGVGLSRGHRQPAAGIIGDREQKVLGEEHAQSPAIRASRCGIQRCRWPRTESAGKAAVSALGDGSGTVTTGQSARRAQARATEPGASRRSHPRCREPSTSTSPPRARRANSTAGRPGRMTSSKATSRGIWPTAWSMAAQISVLPSATRSAFGSCGTPAKYGSISGESRKRGRKTWTSSSRAPRRRASPIAQDSAHQLARERLIPTINRGTRLVAPLTSDLFPQPGRAMSPSPSRPCLDGRRPRQASGRAVVLMSAGLAAVGDVRVEVRIPRWVTSRGRRQGGRLWAVCARPGSGQSAPDGGTNGPTSSPGRDIA
jgi:hypothetical protein